MGQLDRPSDLSSATPDTAQESLSSLTQELEALKHSLVAQLKQEISQLQDRKTTLMAETVELERNNQAQRQQQQELAQQLAPIIAQIGRAHV